MKALFDMLFQARFANTHVAFRNPYDDKYSIYLGSRFTAPTWRHMGLSSCYQLLVTGPLSLLTTGVTHTRQIGGTADGVISLSLMDLLVLLGSNALEAARLKTRLGQI